MKCFSASKTECSMKMWYIFFLCHSKKKSSKQGKGKILKNVCLHTSMYVCFVFCFFILTGIFIWFPWGKLGCWVFRRGFLPQTPCFLLSTGLKLFLGIDTVLIRCNINYISGMHVYTIVRPTDLILKRMHNNHRLYENTCILQYSFVIYTGLNHTLLP